MGKIDETPIYHVTQGEYAILSLHAKSEASIKTSDSVFDMLLGNSVLEEQAAVKGAALKRDVYDVLSGPSDIPSTVLMSLTVDSRRVSVKNATKYLHEVKYLVEMEPESLL